MSHEYLTFVAPLPFLNLWKMKIISNHVLSPTLQAAAATSNQLQWATETELFTLRSWPREKGPATCPSPHLTRPESASQNCDSLTVFSPGTQLHWNSENTDYNWFLDKRHLWSSSKRPSLLCHYLWKLVHTFYLCTFPCYYSASFKSRSQAFAFVCLFRNARFSEKSTTVSPDGGVL